MHIPTISPKKNITNGCSMLGATKYMSSMFKTKKSKTRMIFITLSLKTYQVDGVVEIPG